MPGRFLETEYGGYGMGGISSRIPCLVKRISENGVSSNKNFHLHRKRIFFTGKKPCIIYIINMHTRTDITGQKKRYISYEH